MSYSIGLTQKFERDFKFLSKKYKSIEKDPDELFDSLIKNPFIGTPPGKDCYKVRVKITSKGKGKSGGGRLITCVKVINEKIYLLTLYDKSQQATISDKELDNMLKEAGLL